MKKYLSLFFTTLLFSSLSAQDCSDLFFSEYVEGPANNNGLEIYNPSTNTFDLSAYSVNRYGNGSSSGPDTWPLSGSIGPGQTVSIGNGQTDSVWVTSYWSVPVDTVFYNACNLHGSGIYPTPFYFNGDDAITLEKDGGIIDIIGKVGEDPGAAWTDDASAGFTDANGGTWWTKRQTLVRKPTVKKGVTMNPIVFNPTLEWDSLPDATYSGLGSHNCDCFSSNSFSQIKNTSFVVYPNPANIGDNIIINTYDKIKQVYISDFLGRSSISVPSSGYKAVINSSNLNTGSYIIQIELEKGSSIEHKIIIN
ncbi:MAG: T9SS type A sorting domain-containing protein [Flavobacteriales bacterium]|jgi:hypothetical protein|nr:T9SS type A sorting domain-containing protein [Flavobacteriales bacterium]